MPDGKDGVPSKTIAEVLRAVEETLEDAGLPEARAEARHILRAAGVSPADLVARPGRPLDPAQVERIREIARRRGAREPLSRIMGEREFYGRAFEISAATLDPRADSETLIEAALDVVHREGWRSAPIRVIDVGTGSGCLLVTLLLELPRASGLGTDISAETLAVAQGNARRHGLGARARFETRRSLIGIEETFDLFVSNPPYLPSSEIATLDAEVRDHDPRAALDGGASGLDIYREIAAGLSRAVPAGWALFEAGAGQAGAVETILREENKTCILQQTSTWKDLGGHVRCVGVKIRS